ncbi:MAG TPA: oxygenase MpaB family protein [Kofleriaceae bacterium]|nr:oxygenase MpaB family protein [Kofleriaceae bacterium]
MGIVSRDQLEAGLARAAAQTREHRAGIYGPGSVSWEINREVIQMWGGGRAILLQLAHPFVAHAIDQHSQTRTDARGRFQRTFAHVFAMAFGDLDQAFRAARRVHAIHTRVHGEIDEDVGSWPRGTRYHANDVGALFWVHATLVDTSIAVREQLFGALDAYRAERFYQEQKRFAYLFGIRDEDMPADYPAFRAYMDRMLRSGEIAVGRPAREIARFVLAAPTPPLAPVMDWYQVMTAGLLPERLRGEFGLRFGRLERTVYQASIAAMRRAIKLVPRRLRYFPGYLEAEARVGGRRPRLVGRLADRLAASGLGFRPRGT